MGAKERGTAHIRLAHHPGSERRTLNRAKPLFARFCAEGGGKIVHFEAVAAEGGAIVLA